MKKIFILIIIGFAVAILSALGLRYLMSHQRVQFDVNSDVREVVVFESSNKEVARISSSTTITLRDGIYYAVPHGDKIADDKINFDLKGKSKTVVIDPDYSTRYRQQLVAAAMPEVETALMAAYPNAYPRYEVVRGEIYKKGQWLGLIIRPKVKDERQQPDFLRVLLTHSSQRWAIVGKPQPVISRGDAAYKNTPTDVIRAVNRLSL